MGSTSCSPSRGWGPSARSGSCRTSRPSACCRTRRAPAQCSPTTWLAVERHVGGEHRAAHRRNARRQSDARRRACAAVPARVPEAAGGAALRTGRREARGVVRERVRARSPCGRRLRTGRHEPLLLDDRHDGVAGVRRHARRRARAAGHHARAVLRGARPRPAGDLDRARARAESRGRADPRPRDDSRRRRAARTRRVARAEAVARRGRQRRAHPLLAVGRRAQPLSRRRCRRPPLRRGARLPRRRARAPARPLRPDRAELQFVPPHRPAVLGGRVHLLGPRQPRGAAPCPVGLRGHGGGVHERGAEVRGLELQPLPRARRADRRRPRRARARSGAAGAGGGRPRDDSGGGARAPPHPAAAGDAGGGARRARGGRRPDSGARAGADDFLPGSAPFGVGRLLSGRRGIRAARSLPEVLSAVGLVDHHAHGILRAPPATLDEFRGLFSESPDPRQWPHVATSLTYRRAVRELAGHFDVDGTEQAVYEHRLARDPDEYAAALLRATGTEILLVDDGFPPPGTGVEWEELGELAACRALPVLRLETHGPDSVAGAREAGFAALKTIAAYRGGLDRVSEQIVAALEANEATGRPLPVQVHCGFGDSDVHLWRADPTYLKPLLERFRETPFVLLHCYPFVREAGWLAHVYGNVWFGLSLA